MVPRKIQSGSLPKPVENLTMAQ
uniref:Uncharacterized protein n=1 Tax=Moniliophthora roreri TaxID=221103 RepID=A0A0W0FE19_MONRR